MRSATGTAIILLSLLLVPLPSGAVVADNDVLVQATQNLEAGKHYHVTTYLVRFLKENPGTPHRRELLQLIVKAYARSERKKKAAQALGELVAEFPEAAASLDAELLQLANEERVALPSPPPFVNPFETPDKKEEVAAAAPPKAAVPETKGEEQPAAVPAAEKTEKKESAPAAEETAAAPAPVAKLPEEKQAPAPPEPEKQAAAAATAPETPAPEKVATASTSDPNAAAASPPPTAAEPSLPEKSAAVEPSKPPAANPVPPRTDEEKPAVTAQASPPALSPAVPSAAAVPSPAAPPAPHARLGEEKKPEPAPVLSELSKALRKPSPAAKGTKPAVSGSGFTLTFADITKREKLDELLRTLRVAGLQPRVREMETISTRYRVVSECFADRKSAERIVAQLKPLANGPYIIRQGAAYCAAAASFTVEENAAIEQKRLEEKGLRLSVLKAEVPFVVWQVSAGSFARTEEAEKALKALTARGIGATIAPLK